MIELVLVLALLGLVVYLIEQYVPMAAGFKVAIRVIVIICLVLYLVRLFGLDIPVPSFRR